MVTFGKTTGRILKYGTDPLGRWTYVIYNGTEGKTIMVITVYHCNRPTNKTGRAAWHQQQTLLTQLGRRNTNPRHNFREDIDRFLQQQISEITDIIIMGDFNETNHSTSLIQHLMTKYQLYDLWDTRHEEDANLRTCLRGKTRIDHMLGTHNAKEALRFITFEPFTSRYKGDHRALTADFDIQQLFGNANENNIQTSQRLIRSNDPKNVVTYITHLHNHADEHNLFDRIQKLLDKGEPDHEEAESIDKQITRGCVYAEKQCQRKRTPFFLRKENQLQLELRLLLQLRRRRKNDLPTQSIETAMRKLGITTNDEPIEPRITELRDQLKKIFRDRCKLRDEELQELIVYSEAAGDKQYASALRQIRKSEQKAKTYKMFRSVQEKNQQQQGIDRIRIPETWPPPFTELGPGDNLPDPKSIPKEAANWIEIHNPREIEYYLLLRNRRHFGQAHGTPFTTPSFTTKFNWAAETSMAEMVLKGDFPSDDLDYIAKLFLSHCQQIPDIQPQPDTITLRQFKGKMKVWRETTSTSPSGRHLGHYKALFARIDPTLDTITQATLARQQKNLANLYVDMINYAIKYRYSFERWKQITNSMIYKETNNTHIHRLRVIHIYEADLNFLLGIKWKLALASADNVGAVNNGQHGGRPGKQATTLTLMEELRYDYAYSTRIPFAQMDNDASACYDRIIPSMASLVGKRFGIHNNVIFVHATTLQEAKYRLKTTGQISETFYQHCDDFPIYGTGQGSGNSPFIWCFISSVLFDCHDTECYGAYFTTSDGRQTVRLTILGFVDDSTCCTSLRPMEQPSVRELLHRLQHDTQLWHDLLWFSGGKLELSKCSYHMLAFDFQSDGKPIPIRNVKDTLEVNDSNGQPINITYKSIDESHKTLGHHKAPSSTGEKNFEHVLKRAQKLTETLMKCPATSAEARTFFETILLPAVGYTLPQSCHTKKQLDRLQRCINPIYAKCGYNRNTHRAVLFGPEEYGGAGFLPFSVYDGTGKCLHFLKLWRSPHLDEGKLLRIAVSRVQDQSGISVSIFKDVHRKLPHLEARWIPNLRNFLSEINGSFNLYENYCQIPLRSNDWSIMDYATHPYVSQLTDNQICKINYCRMYLGVTWISEISDPTGQFVLEPFLRGERPPEGYIPPPIFPVQGRPSRSTWRIFEKFIRRFLTPSLQHTEPLGTWNSTVARGYWPSYYHNGQVYRKRGNKWEVYSTDYKMREVEWIPTASSQPVSASFNQGMCSSVRISLLTPIHSALPTPTCFHTWIVQQLPNAMEVVGHFTFHLPEEEFSRELTRGTTLQAVSDGSDINHCMSFGWVLSTPKGKRLASSSGPAFGHGTSHRAEATGIKSIAWFARLAKEYYGVYFLKVNFVADNSSIINTCIKRNEYEYAYANSTVQNDFDIVQEIFEVINSSQIDSTFTHVMGHQDDRKDGQELTLHETLNIEADQLATDYQKLHKRYRPTVYPSRYNPIVMDIQGSSITSNYKTRIQQAACEPAYLQYLQEKREWEPLAFKDIAWEDIPLGLRKIGGSTPTITKIMNGLLPTNAYLYKIKQRDTDTCPLCGELETEEHIFRCNHQSRILWRRATMKTLDKFFKSTKTNDNLSDTIRTCLTCWLDHGTVDSDNISRTHHSAIKAQSSIGWIEMFRGHISQHWSEDYQTLYNHEDRCDPHAWAGGLIAKLLQQTVTLWNSRNKDVHGHDHVEQNVRLHALFTKQIAELHERQQESRHCDTHLFLDDHKSFCATRTAQQLDCWIRQYRPAIRTSYKLAAKQSIQRTRTITTYYKPRTRKSKQLLAAQRSHTPHRLRSHSRWKQTQLFCFLAKQAVPTRLSPIPP